MKNKKQVINFLVAGYEGAGYEMCKGYNCIYMCKRGYALVSVGINEKGVYVMHGKHIVAQYA